MSTEEIGHRDVADARADPFRRDLGFGPGQTDPKARGRGKRICLDVVDEERRCTHRVAAPKVAIGSVASVVDLFDELFEVVSGTQG